MTDAELAEIEARANAATEGPWRIGGYGDMVESAAVGANGCAIEGWFIADMVNENDAPFISSARADVPALVAALREARAENERLRAQVSEAWAGE